MTNSKKPQDQKTKASATELDTTDLEKVDAGVKGFSGVEGKTGIGYKLGVSGIDQIKFGDKSIKGSKVQLTEKIASNIDKNKF